MHTNRMASATGTEPIAQPGQRQGIVDRSGCLYPSSQWLGAGRMGDSESKKSEVLGAAQAVWSRSPTNLPRRVGIVDIIGRCCLAALLRTYNRLAGSLRRPGRGVGIPRVLLNWGNDAPSACGSIRVAYGLWAYCPTS